MSVKIMGVTINSTRKSEVLRLLTLQRKQLLHIATVNPEYIMHAQLDKEFREVLTKSVTVADGSGVVWASKILFGKDIERVSGSWLTEQILSKANERGEKVFLLGAGEGVAQKAALFMTAKYPRAVIVSYEGAENIRLERREEASMTIAKINAFEPDYLLVAYGAPRQDMWIEENRQYLRARVAVGVGGVLDEWAGVVALCPPFVDKIGFKWLWRLIHEPRRLPRIMRVFHFAMIVLYHKLTD